MGYHVKWVEKNLGISRKALRLFEKYDLMPKANNSVRDYSEEDINRIWLIRVFQGMGFTLREIAAFESEEDIQEKLKHKVAELEQHIGYAKQIIFTGRIPSRPKEMGSVNFDDFQKRSLDEWNMNNSPEAKAVADLVNNYLSMPEDEFQDTQIGKVLQFFEQLDISEMSAEKKLVHIYLPRAIANRKNFGANHPEVQLLVKMYYDELVMQDEEFSSIQKDAFARHIVSQFKAGDGGKMNRITFGEEECDFIADAIAVFGGYENYDSI